MLLTRFRGWLLAGLLLTGASPVHAQHDHRVNPPGVSGDHQPMFFDHAELSEYGTANRAKTGFFFQYDKLIWNFSSPQRSDIGDEAAQQFVVGAPLLNNLDNSFIQDDWVQGNRYEAGYVDDDHGFLASIARARRYHQGITGDDFDVVFTDPLDVDGGGNDVELFTFNSAIIENFTEFTTIELMHVTRWDPLHFGGTVEWLVGLRFANLSDTFTFDGDLGNGLDFQNKINNYLVGPQVGIRGNRQIGHWRFGGEARVMAAINFQHARLDGNITGAPSFSSINFDRSVTDEEWAPLGEIRLDISYQLTNAISLRLGYTGIAMGGIGRASRRVVYTLPTLEIADGNKSDAFYINGINFGVEINR